MQHTAAAPDTVLEAPQVTAPFNAGQACQDSMQIQHILIASLHLRLPTAPHSGV